MKRVSILTDNPVLYENSMYLSQIEKELRHRKALVDVFVLRSNGGILEKKIALERTVRAIALVRELRKYDIIHIHFTFPLGSLYCLLKRIKLASTALIIHTHGYDIFTVPEVGYGLRRTVFGDLLTKQTWSTATTIITVCRAAAQKVACVGIPSDKIAILYNGVDHKLFSVNRSLKERCPKKFAFLNVASFSPIKNHIALLEAFRKTAKLYKGKIDIKLILVGDGPLRNMIEHTAPEGVIFYGRIQHENLPSIYCNSDAFILPSKSEGHPWSLLEAMSCEVPSIASSVGGIPETIQNPELLINPWNIDDIKDKMISLIEMPPEERAFLGKRNREIVLRNFTMSLHIENLLHIYEDVMG